MPLLIILGAAVIILGIVCFNKFPAISPKLFRIIIIIGLLIFIIGLLLSFVLPKKGLLQDGKTGDTGNDDVSGGYGEDGEGLSQGMIMVDGTKIIVGDKVLYSISDLDNYLTSSEWKGGYELIDRYAVYDNYMEVKKLLERKGFEILSERTGE